MTGCTDGIGKEYAYQLAAKGLNIVLVARNATLLEEISKEIGMPIVLFCVLALVFLTETVYGVKIS